MASGCDRPTRAVAVGGSGTAAVSVCGCAALIVVGGRKKAARRMLASRRANPGASGAYSACRRRQGPIARSGRAGGPDRPPAPGWPPAEIQDGFELILTEPGSLRPKRERALAGASQRPGNQPHSNRCISLLFHGSCLDRSLVRCRLKSEAATVEQPGESPAVAGHGMNVSRTSESGASRDAADGARSPRTNRAAERARSGPHWRCERRGGRCGDGCAPAAGQVPSA